MKGQAPHSHRRLTDEIKNSVEGTGASLRHSLNADDASDDNSGYVQLGDSSKKVGSRATAVLSTLTDLGISLEVLRQAGVIEQDLQRLLAKELSCSRYFRWAFVDNFVEKILQGLMLNKQDVSQEEVNFCRGMVRQMSSGRSILLHQTCGLKKVYAARGVVLTAEMALNQAVKLSIAFFLGYRLYEQFTTGSSNFSEFTTIFNENNKKGVNSLVNVLAKVETEWLYLLLTSPAIIGILKGLWDTQKSQPLTETTVAQLQEAVNYHTNTLLKKSYLWGNVLRQLIPMPGFTSVSERVQKAEQQVRWDGRITNTQRESLFSNIEKLALQGNGMSQINAMQSLAKIVHSLSIKDFEQLQNVGYSKETLIQILRFKTQSLRDLRTFSNRAHIQPEAQQNPEATLQQPPITRFYAAYLLWWLGMSNFKYSLLFWPFKLGKLVFEGLFLKTLVANILEAIQCPDKKGFSISSGEYPVWANQLTLDCFKEFVRQFRFIATDELFEPFLKQLSNFDFRLVDSVNLSGKNLTSNEIGQILNILYQRAHAIKILNLSLNRMNDTVTLLFPAGLQSLDLSSSSIGDKDTQWLNLPAGLQSLDLRDNNIGDTGAQALKLPDSLLFLDLNSNRIADEGAQRLKLPANLQSLDLSWNSIGDAGAQGLKLTEGLLSLDLSFNHRIGVEGAQGLKLPDSLQSLNLGGNSIGDAGAQGLTLPDALQSLDLTANSIGVEGAQGLKLPDSLQSLNLWGNDIGADGVQRLKLPANLQSLNLWSNGIGDRGAQRLTLPANLQSLVLWDNNIGAEGARGLRLPANLQSLGLSLNSIGDAGAQGLTLPANLQSLDLRNNGIGAEGAQGLKLPESLLSLDLSSNYISAEGAEGLKLPDNLLFLYLSSDSIGDGGAQGLKLPESLLSLDLSWNSIGDAGAQALKLPDSLLFLDLNNNRIADEGAQGLKLPGKLLSLDLSFNSIGTEGAQSLKLSGSLQSLNLRYNGVADEGTQGLKLPANLQSLDLRNNGIGPEGAQGLKLPDRLQSLDLSSNYISDEGTQGLKLPESLFSLDLSWNGIGDAGVKALLQKIPKTNVTTIDLTGNLYNSTAINSNRIIQQQILLRNCQDKLCHANTPLWTQDEYQTSGAARTQPSLFFSWLKKPFDKLSEYSSDCISAILDNLGGQLEKVLSRSPSYFPNIHSPTVHDWQPSGSVMLHQFKAGGSSTLLLSTPQTAIHSSFNAIAR